MNIINIYIRGWTNANLSVADGVWYCSRRCSDAIGVDQDHIRNYSLAVTYLGLLDLCHRDMIREADGPAMLAMWRLNMPRFWAGNHYKYMIIAHRLIAGIPMLKKYSSVLHMPLHSLYTSKTFINILGFRFHCKYQRRVSREIMLHDFFRIVWLAASPFG